MKRTLFCFAQSETARPTFDRNVPEIRATFSDATSSCACFWASAGWPLSSRKRSEEHTSELQSLITISYAVFCLKKKIAGRSQHDALHRRRHALARRVGNQNIGNVSQAIERLVQREGQPFFFFNDRATTEIYTVMTLFPYTTLFRSPTQPSCHPSPARTSRLRCSGFN